MTRLFHSVFAAFYLFFITKATQHGFEIPFLLAAIIVGLISCVLMAILAAISVRFSKTHQDERRFQLSTVLLLVLFLSIHLAITRQVLQRASGGAHLDVNQIVMISILGLINVFVSTYLLLGLLEALVFCANLALKWLAVRRRSR